jgi:putative YhbY family RNA-binding protein
MTDANTPKILTSAERQSLKGRAHRLNPVVLIGNEGLSPAVVAEIDRALAAHELIKIRVMGAEREERQRLLDEICSSTGAAPVQHIGKILVVFRERPAEEAPAPKRSPRPASPARRRAPAAAKRPPGRRPSSARGEAPARSAGRPTARPRALRRAPR